MKRIYVSILLSVMLLSSCGVAAPKNESSTPIPSVTTTTPTTTVNEKDEISAKLASLMKEDGTGEINLQMTVPQVSVVLDKYDIEYKIDETGRYLYTVDDWSYTEDFYHGYGSFAILQSYKGLKIGDSITKVLELYGEPDDSYNKGTELVYDYHTATASDPFFSPVVFRVKMRSEAVTSMVIQVDIPYDKMYE